MWKENADVTADKIGFPRGITSTELTAAREEMETFAQSTLNQLIEAERLAYYRIPSISLFCRLDIGVTPNELGELRYFVNEVTRGPTTTCLFSGSTPDLEDIAPNLGADFAGTFYKYLCTEHLDLAIRP
jgi:hypothetical protein